MVFLLRASLLTGVCNLIEDQGGKPAHQLRRYGIHPAIETMPDSFVQFDAAVRLLEACARDLECPNFGLQLSTRQGLSMLGPVAVLARNANNVEDAFFQIAKFMHLLTPSIRLEVATIPERGVAQIQFVPIDSRHKHAPQMYELTMGNGQSITRLLSGTKARGTYINFTHSPVSSKQTYRDFFECDVRFNQEVCSAEMSIDIVQRAIAGADRETARLAAAYLEDQVSNTSENLVSQIKQLIARLLPTGHCTMNIIAEQIHLHPRTLQRQLSVEGKTFEQILDDERKRLALHYLAIPHLKLTQIAGLLGYAEQSALNRSCKRWFDQTPNQLRSKG